MNEEFELCELDANLFVVMQQTKADMYKPWRAITHTIRGFNTAAKVLNELRYSGKGLGNMSDLTRYLLK